MVDWHPSGEVCPICRGEGRTSIRYPAAICRDCETRLVDWVGRPVSLENTSIFGSGIKISNSEDLIVDEDTPIFVDRVVCWAREARFGGVVVQPVAAWLEPTIPIDDPDRRRTLADFDYNGRKVLETLIAASPWGSIDQAIASLSVFAHPDVISAAGRRAMFRTIRGNMSDRGKIVDGIMYDDNTSPALAFEWSTEFERLPGTDVTCCHLYPQSRDVESYTDLRNIFYAPSFIAKRTDSQATSLPEQHALNVLRYRAFVLHGYCGPSSTTRLSKPAHYDELEWADTIGAGITAVDLESRLRERLRRKPKDRITKSVAQCGWAFSDGRPDSDVKYSGK